MNQLLCYLLLITLLMCSCMSRAKARVQAQTAFAAGQQQALTQMRDTERKIIRVIGNVRNHEVPWTEGMTLAQVIVAARCYEQHDPSQIVVIRRGERSTIDTKVLLRGDDVPLEAGDTIEIHP